MIWPLSNILGPLSAAAAPAPSYPLPAWSSLRVWLKADAGVLNAGGGAAGSGDYVSVWRDQSGHGNDATPDVSGSNPATFYTGVRAGLPAVGIVDSTVATLLDLSGGEWTVFLVAANEDRFNANRILSGINNNWLLGWWNGSQGVSYYDGGFVGASSRVAPDQWHVYTGKGDGSLGYLYDRGTLLGSGSAHAGPNGLRIGGGYQGGEISTCYLAEVIGYAAALSDSDRAAVESYLINKWSVTTPPVITSPSDGTTFDNNGETFSVIWTGGSDLYGLGSSPASIDGAFLGASTGDTNVPLQVNDGNASNMVLLNFNGG